MINTLLFTTVLLFLIVSKILIKKTKNLIFMRSKKYETILAINIAEIQFYLFTSKVLLFSSICLVFTKFKKDCTKQKTTWCWKIIIFIECLKDFWFLILMFFILCQRCKNQRFFKHKIILEMLRICLEKMLLLKILQLFQFKQIVIKNTEENNIVILNIELDWSLSKNYC